MVAHVFCSPVLDDCEIWEKPKNTVFRGLSKRVAARRKQSARVLDEIFFRKSELFYHIIQFGSANFEKIVAVGERELDYGINVRNPVWPKVIQSGGQEKAGCERKRDFVFRVREAV